MNWIYSDTVKDHFFNPRGVLRDGEKFAADGVGTMGSPMCGDVMKVWIRVDQKKDRILEMRWQTFGCASAISSTSMLSEMIAENNGMQINDALTIKPKDILDRLEGLPKNKIHCSVLGDQALHAAIFDYFKKTHQNDRIKKSQ
jgi:NifU-like protein involved in Fe-S cluster formation